MSGEKKILIVDDHPMIREGLKIVIGQSKVFKITGEAAKCKDALEMALELQPDIILLDISLPDGSGIQLAGEIRTALPQTTVLMMSVHNDRTHIGESFQAGVSGYLVKDSLPEMLMEALDVVSQGGYYFGSAISRETVEQIKNFDLPSPSDAVQVGTRP